MRTPDAIGSVLRGETGGFRYTFRPTSTLVSFSVMVNIPGGGTSWRTFRAVMELPAGLEDNAEYIERRLATRLQENFASFGSYDGNGLPTLHIDSATERPVVQWQGSQRILTRDDIFGILARSSRSTRDAFLRRQSDYFRSRRLYGYVDDHVAQHRAFRYHIRGADVPTLMELLPHTIIDNHTQDCDKMCMYRMLQTRNPERPEKRMYYRDFHPECVNQWFHTHGYTHVGGLTDGLTPEDLQAHAIAHRYGHAALDITRSLIVFHNPEKPRKDLHTVAYTVIGDHAIPFTDPDIIRSIMNSAQSMGQRRQGNYSFYSGMRQNQSSTIDAHRDARKKRSRSVDRLFQADRSSLAEQRQDGLRWDAPIDFEREDREEEIEGAGEDSQVTASHGNRTRKPKLYPTVDQTDRFRFFTKENDQAFIRTHLRPDYQEGSLSHLVHYFVCTDESNVEFLYDYCLRILCWDPTTCARTYNGTCHTLQINNVIWTAQPDIHSILRLHGIFQPKEPVRLSGLASYAFRLFERELRQIGRFGTNVWDCMSQYPPNLQRLLDNHHPYHRPKLLQKTFHAPYLPPDRADGEPKEVIPWDERQRVDLIRSYTACLLQIGDDRDEYPIHDITNQVVPFDATLHGSIPVGHYLVDVPNKAQRRERGVWDDYERLPCFAEDGEPRMMSHRMLRALMTRNLVVPADIRLVCLPDPVRQANYGTALVTGITRFIHTVYQHPELQDPKDPCPKMLVNYLVGLCNGTTLPHSGCRYAFRSLEELWQLVLRAYSEDQLQKVRISRQVGTDAYWDQTTYCHYEMTTSGLVYRPFHMQPVYNLVLETQAIAMFDLCRPIPLGRLIQLNIDAVEFRVLSKERGLDWVRTLEKNQVDTTDYTTQTPKTLLDNRYLGRYKPENPKGPEKWKTYHYQFNQARQDTHCKHFLTDGTSGVQGWGDADGPLLDPEDRDWVASWRSTLRIVQPKDAVRDPDYAHRLCVEWLTPSVESPEKREYTGVLLTGPAGTGKTHLLRNLYDYAVRLGLNVVRTAFTHAACVQLGPDAVTLSALFGLDHMSDYRCILTMSRRFAAHLRSLHIDILIVDEISMIPMFLWEALMLLHRSATQTRIVLSGDFCQLPPVEPGRERPEGWNYFDTSDILPYLLYDRVRNVGGQWVQLTECMRTDDPLLKQICLDPTFVTTQLQPDHYPIRPHQPIWRFLCATNRTRKACNWYCMQRWREAHPDTPTVPFCLEDIYVLEKRNPLHATTGRPLPARFDENHYRTEFRSLMSNFSPQMRRKDPSSSTSTNQDAPKPKWAPKHYEYLQNFAYGVGMEVVSRNTVRDKQKGTDGPMIVNNRRAQILAIDTETRRVTLQWIDVLMRRRAPTSGTAPPPAEDIAVARPDDPPNARDVADATIDERDREPLVLSFYDFAFNFVPGFCVTVHLAQGETIREHYGILDWNEIRTKQSMAYVAVTRASHPEYLHILTHYFMDPWDTKTSSDVATNVLKKMYHMFKTDFQDRLPWHLVSPDLYCVWKKRLVEAHLTQESVPCARCSRNVRLRGYLDSDSEQFRFVVVPDTMDFELCCDRCFLAAYPKK